MKKRVGSNEAATKKPGGVTGKGFMPGQSGNPKGRAPLAEEVREALAADTLTRYAKLKELSSKAEKDGDLKTAATIELALLKKTVPDATELVVHVPNGVTVRKLELDPRKLTKEQLEMLRDLQKATQAG